MIVGIIRRKPVLTRVSIICGMLASLNLVNSVICSNVSLQCWTFVCLFVIITANVISFNAIASSVACRLLLDRVLACFQCTGVRHMNISCDSCKQQGILGTRWRCVQCPELNLCDCCYMTDKHDVNHQFIRYDFPCSTQSGLVPRTSATSDILIVTLTL